MKPPSAETLKRGMELLAAGMVSLLSWTSKTCRAVVLGTKVYSVVREHGVWHCSCEAWMFNSAIHCKHIVAVSKLWRNMKKRGVFHE